MLPEAAKPLPNKVLQAGAKSAAALYEKERTARKIITFCAELDAVLGGGIHTGQITECCARLLAPLHPQNSHDAKQ